MSKRFLAVVSAALVAVAFATTALGSDVAPATKSPTGGVVDTPVEASAQGGQHGAPGNHLPPSSANVELVSKLKLSNPAPERFTDVSSEGNYAYVGNAAQAYSPNDCTTPGGVHVVDISDIRNPREINFIPTTLGSWVSEGVHAVHIETAAFRGDILAHSNELCAQGGLGGMSLWDVTNPRSPQPLALHAGDMVREAGSDNVLPRTIHSVFIWQQGANAYAVLVDNHELEDVDIFDITDPRNPRLIAETGLPDWPTAGPQRAIGTFPFSFIHDVVVKNVGGTWQMLVSYWDAGYVLLNVNDPANPVFIEDSDFPTPDTLFPAAGPEGNAHYAEFSHDNRYILVADEDFTPYGTTTPFRITTGPNAGKTYASSAVSGATGSIANDLPDKRLNGPVVYGGYGCPPGGGDDPLSPGSAPFPSRAASGLVTGPDEEAIIVFQRGPANDPSAPETGCFPGEKAAQGIAAGYDAVVIVNRHSGGTGAVCGSGAFPAGSRIVAVCTTHAAFHDMFNTAFNNDVPYPPEPNTEPDIGTRGEKIDITAIFDGWGYMRLLDATTLQELDSYAVQEATDPRYSSGFGDLSIHETATDPTHPLTYVAYYSAGFRVVSHEGGQLNEVGHHIDEGGNNTWGVEVHMTPAGDRYILASDRDFGLYVYRYGADAAIRKTAPASGTVGQTVAYTLNVSNTGTIDGRNVTVTDTLPSNVAFSAASASQGTCTGSGSTVTCNLGVLARNGNAVVTILGTATAAGAATNTAVITTSDVDPSTGNNRAQATTTLAAAPAQPPAQPPVQPPPVQPPPPRGRPAARCRVPNLRGRTLAQARAAIRRAGCSVGTVSRRRSRTAAAGRVIGQSPRAGARVRRGTRVSIVLAATAAVRPPFTG